MSKFTAVRKQGGDGSGHFLSIADMNDIRYCQMIECIIEEYNSMEHCTICSTELYSEEEIDSGICTDCTVEMNEDLNYDAGMLDSGANQ